MMSFNDHTRQGVGTSKQHSRLALCTQQPATPSLPRTPKPLTSSRSKTIDHHRQARTKQIDKRRVDPSRCNSMSRRSAVHVGVAERGVRRSGPHQTIIVALVATLLGQQATLTWAMLDALKALFILTGASTYLVTKYVNVTNQTSPASGAGYHYFPMLTSNSYGLNASTLNASSFALDPALNFLKDLKGGGSQHLAAPNGAPSLASPSLLRPIYVLAVEEEEDERRLPKSLFNLSVSDRLETSGTQASLDRRALSIEYVLDSRLDDFESVMESFMVNGTTGELFLIKPLNRDPPNGRANWKFSVQARQKPSQFILAIVDIHINVRDINDNRPMFEQRTYRTSLMENGPAGQILTRVTAIDFDDADTADNGKVVYSLLKTPASSAAVNNQLASSLSRRPSSMGDNFQLDPHTGVLTALACCFDREKRASYELIARATDAGGLWDEASIVVTISDLNDCPPKFLEPPKSLVLNEDDIERFNQLGLVSIAENATSATRAFDENIYTLPVADDDLAESNHFHYEIVHATNCSLYHRFYMMANDDGSGTLYGTRAKLLHPLEYNKTYTCELTISVQDTVRDTEVAVGETYEDQTTLTLIYRNTTKPPETSNAAIKQTISEHQHPPMVGDKSEPVMVRNLTLTRSKEDNDQSSANGLKSFDLSEKQVPHSSCSLCQNGGRCVVTETGFRFRCHCPIDFDGALCERNRADGDEFAGFLKRFDTVLMKIANNRLFFIGSVIIFINLFVVTGVFSVWLVRRIRQTVRQSESPPSPVLPAPTTMNPESHVTTYRPRNERPAFIMQSHPDIVIESTPSADRFYQQRLPPGLMEPVGVEFNAQLGAALNEEDLDKLCRYQYLIG